MTKYADILLTNAHVLTMDESLNQYNPGAVAVVGDSIDAVGHEAEIKKEYKGKETIDCKGKVLMPGLINAHTHVHDPFARPGRRSAPGCMADGLYDARRARVRFTRIRPARYFHWMCRTHQERSDHIQ